jgi:hypothetical protein
MIPISFSWETREKAILLKWDGFFSLSWKEGKVSAKLIGVPIPLRLRKKRIHFPLRWGYAKELLSLLRKWRLKKIEGTLSLPDPMMNGVFYGWLSALETGKKGRKVRLSVNFLGENWFSGEAVLSPKVIFSRLKSWVFLFLRERRGRWRQ